MRSGNLANLSKNSSINPKSELDAVVFLVQIYNLL